MQPLLLPRRQWESYGAIDQVDMRYMNDQRIVRWSTFGGKDPGDGAWVPGIRAQAVDRFGRERNQLTRFQGSGGAIQILRGRRGNLGFGQGYPPSGFQREHTIHVGGDFRQTIGIAPSDFGGTPTIEVDFQQGLADVLKINVTLADFGKSVFLA